MVKIKVVKCSTRMVWIVYFPQNLIKNMSSEKYPVFIAGYTNREIQAEIQCTPCLFGWNQISSGFGEEVATGKVNRWTTDNRQIVITIQLTWARLRWTELKKSKISVYVSRTKLQNGIY